MSADTATATATPVDSENNNMVKASSSSVESDTKDTTTAAILTMLYGSKKISIPFTRSKKELSKRIEEVSGIPSNELVIIYKGKKIHFNNDTQEGGEEEKHDIKENCKVMLRRIPSASNNSSSNLLSKNIIKLRKIDKQGGILNERYKQVKSSVEKHVQGFLNKEFTNEALNKDELQIKYVDEEVMKLLEQIDSIIDDDSQFKAERKSTVVRLQSTLNELDVLRDAVKQYRLDTYGEIQHRRGKD